MKEMMQIQKNYQIFHPLIQQEKQMTSSLNQSKSVKILIWVMTGPQNHYTKVIEIRFVRYLNMKIAPYIMNLDWIRKSFAGNPCEKHLGEALRQTDFYELTGRQGVRCSGSQH